MRIAQLDRETWLTRRWDYRAGEHVGMWEPTQSGKTHLAYQMADAALRRAEQRGRPLRFVSAMPKPRSPATRRWAAALDLRIIDGWPPPYTISKPRGWVLWPKHLKNAQAAVNRAHIGEIMRKMLHDQYQQGDSVTLADDVYLLAALYGLNPECEEFWTAGSEGGAGLWAPNQKPSGTLGGGSVSTFSYNSPMHLVFGRDTDRRNQKRFADIGGGIDPEIIAGIVPHLRVFRVQTPGGPANISEKLYIDKRGPYMAIIGI